jgi:hypothetical protein
MRQEDRPLNKDRSVLLRRAMSVTAESLFRSFFWTLYPKDARDLAVARRTDANPAKNPAVLAHLEEAASVFERMAPRAFGEELVLDRTDESVHRLSRSITRARRDAWASRGSPGSPESELFNVVVHGAAYVGACVVARHGGSWSVRRPLWESLVHLSSRAGEAELAVFQWWLKSLADDALDPSLPGATTLADRYRTHVEVPCARPEQLPVIAAPDRKIPRLTKVRYDTLHKHLKAHLPEVRDLGEHFPSAERFDQYGFAWLDFLLVGGGRMLLVHGPGEGGVHLFWIDAGGFHEAAHMPADTFPAHVVRIDGDKVAVVFSHAGKQQVQEMLWWGP